MARRAFAFSGRRGALTSAGGGRYAVEPMLESVTMLGVTVPWAVRLNGEEVGPSQ